MIVDDFVVLGRAAPEILRDGRIECCSIGYSLTGGFMRVYPTNFNSKKFKRWNILKFEIEKNKDDWRNESYKIINNKKDWKNFDDLIEVIGQYPLKERHQLISDVFDEKYVFNNIRDLNDKRKSIGLIKAKVKDFEFREQEPKKRCEDIITLSEHEKKLYLHYNCFPDCYSPIHKQQVLEFGVYEFIRKFPDKAETVVDNLRLFDKDWDIYFIVGNSYKACKSFMIVSILRFKKDYLKR